jgi:hypothetical protein
MFFEESREIFQMSKRFNPASRAANDFADGLLHDRFRSRVHSPNVIVQDAESQLYHPAHQHCS